MSGFEDFSNAAGKRHHRAPKTIQILKDGTKQGTPKGLGEQLVDEAKAGKVSKQAHDTWNIDGFDNASGSGKKTLTSAQGAMIGFASLIIAATLVYAIQHLSKKHAK